MSDYEPGQVVRITMGDARPLDQHTGSVVRRDRDNRSGKVYVLVKIHEPVQFSQTRPPWPDFLGFFTPSELELVP